MDVPLFITTISFVIATLAILGNRSLAKDCRDKLRDEKRDLQYKYDELVRDHADLRKSDLSAAWHIQKELHDLRRGALKDKPFAIGMDVTVIGTSKHGQLIGGDGLSPNRIWRVRFDYGGDPNRRVQGCRDIDYHESLLAHYVDY